MSEKVKAIPDGFHTLTPHITVRDAKGAIEFYKKALGAQVLHVSHTPDGRVMHASLKIGDSVIMLNDEFPEWGGAPAPRSEVNGVTIHVYVDNVDALFNQAVAAGSVVKMPLAEQFWGDRYGTVLDPYGFKWSLATHVKDVSPAEMEKAQVEMMKTMAQKMPQKKTA
jgi:PhnB protein